MCSLIRMSDVFDLFSMQNINFINLPENYVMKYYFFHSLSWPQLPTVAEDSQGNIVGYVLAKLEDENQQGVKAHGHVTSVAVLRQNRKLGLASKLMTLSQQAMQDVFSAEFAALHVRVTNRAAFALYSNTLGYRVHDIDKGYYADKEDAFDMRNYFNGKGGKGRRKDTKEGDGAAETSSAAAEQPETAAAAATDAAATGDNKAAAAAAAATTTEATTAANQSAAAAAKPSPSTSGGGGGSGGKNRRKKR